MKKTPDTTGIEEIWLIDFVIRCNTTKITEDGGNSYNESFRFLLEEGISNVNQQLQKAREEGQKDIIKLANNLTEKPDKAVRYVPLDKLIECWKDQDSE